MYGTWLLRSRTACHQAGTGALDRGWGCRFGAPISGRAVGVSVRSAGCVCGRDLLGRGLLGDGLLGRRSRLFGLHGATKPLAVGLATGAICLCVLNGRRMALDTHPEGQAEVKGLLVGQAELMSELVYPDFLRQRLLLPFHRCRRCQSAHTTLYLRTSRRWTLRALTAGWFSGSFERPTQVVDHPDSDRAPKRPFEGPALDGQINTGPRVPAQPGTSPRQRPPWGQRTVAEPHHPHHGVGRTIPAAPDTGPSRAYAGPSPVGATCPSASGAPVAASIASAPVGSVSSPLFSISAPSGRASAETSTTPSEVTSAA